MLCVRKRDGRIEEWDIEKIASAISKALKESNEKIDDVTVILDRIENTCEKNADSEHVIDVVELHKIVEMTLMKSKCKLTARKYIEYRSQRDMQRLRTSQIMKEVNGLNNESDPDVLNQNANKASRILSTHRDLLAGIVSKECAKEFMTDSIREAHGTKIYCHDQDYALTPGLHNCGIYDYGMMLKNGFKLGNADIESPKSIGTACTVLSQIASTISSSSYGGQTMHRFSEMLRPYAVKSLKKQLKKERENFEAIRKNLQNTVDKSVIRGIQKDLQKIAWRNFEKEVYDAMQTFIYQINTICGTNGQSAFCAISLYPSNDKICRLIVEQYFKCHMNGLGAEHRTPVFPKVLYFVEKGKNLEKDSENYDELCLAMECSTKRMYPDYIMVDSNKKMTGCNDVMSAMGCRSFPSRFLDENGKEKFVAR